MDVVELQVDDVLDAVAELAAWPARAEDPVAKNSAAAAPAAQ
jgi:hypothetical protein